MASAVAIAKGLALTHEAFPTRPITEATAAAWSLFFAETPDADFLRACRIACTTAGRAFFPTPGELTALLQPAATPVDSEAVLRRIGKLGSYHAAAGWVYPSVGAVREALGDAIAGAYSAGGASRLFADGGADGTSVTRDIARRAFAVELEAQQERDPASVLLPPLLEHKQLPSGDGPTGERVALRDVPPVEFEHTPEGFKKMVAELANKRDANRTPEPRLSPEAP